MLYLWVAIKLLFLQFSTIAKGPVCLVHPPAKDFAYWSVSPTTRLAYGSLRPQAILLTGLFRL